jgi:Flp pilus assembly protein TadG
MRNPRCWHKAVQTDAKPARLNSFLKDKKGVTALEFGIVALPFLMFAFGTIGIGLHFFTQNALEHAVGSAARKIRTGQAQKAGTTVAEFKQMVKEEAGPTIDAAKLEVHMQTGDNWNEVTPTSCLDSSGQQTTGTGDGTDAVGDHSGGAGKVVMVTVCYEWEMAKLLPFLELGQMANGSGLIQSSTTFRTEPYE